MYVHNTSIVTKISNQSVLDLVYKLLLLFIYLFIYFFDLGFTAFQEYVTYIEPIVHQRWAKTGEPGEKPPDHP